MESLILLAAAPLWRRFLVAFLLYSASSFAEDFSTSTKSTVESSTSDTITSPSTPVAVADTTSISHTFTIVGIAVGIPLGLILLALLACILRRHRKSQATSKSIASPDVFSPPNGMAHSNSEVFDNVELEAYPQSPFELDSYSKPNELDGTPTTAPHPGNRVSTPITTPHPGFLNSTISELEGSPGRFLEGNNRVSVMTTTEVNRFSAVSALDPSPQVPRYLYRMYRPSGLLPVSGSESSLAPPAPISGGEHENSGTLHGEQV